jgi:hypothetical protein
MPVCLKCGWEIVIGPAGCACTQAARHERRMEEAARCGEELAERLRLAGFFKNMPKKTRAELQEEARSKIWRARSSLREQLENVDAQMKSLLKTQSDLMDSLKVLWKKCKHPVKYKVAGVRGVTCNDCGFRGPRSKFGKGPTLQGPEAPTRNVKGGY